MVLLSLRGNKLSHAIEPDFIGLMKDHKALLRVDLRQNDPGSDMGILKVGGRLPMSLKSAQLLSHRYRAQLALLRCPPCF